MLGVTFERTGEDVKHTFKDWGLRWLEPYSIDYPEPKLHLVQIPGADDVLDLTETLTGHVRYEQRNFELRFELSEADYFDHEQKRMTIANYLHGKSCKVILDTDTPFYYRARLTVEYEKNSRSESVITVKGVANAYKIYRDNGLEDWIWDDFNFDTDYAWEMKDISLDSPDGASFSYLPPTARPVAPRITCTAELVILLLFENRTLESFLEGPLGSYRSKTLSQGLNYDPFFQISGDPILAVFLGDGSVTIEYEGGVL